MNAWDEGGKGWCRIRRGADTSSSSPLYERHSKEAVKRPKFYQKHDVLSCCLEKQTSSHWNGLLSSVDQGNGKGGKFAWTAGGLIFICLERRTCLRVESLQGASRE